MRTPLLALALTAAFGAAHASLAPQTVVQWNFNSNPPDGVLTTGTLVPNIGTGTASLVGGTTATFASGAAGGGSTDPATADNSGWNTMTYPAQGAGDRTRGVQFAVSTAGWFDVVVSWDQRHSNTSARHVQFQYSTDGVSFIDHGALFVADRGDAWFNGRTVDLSTIVGVNNNPNFAFRIVSAFAPGGTGYEASNTGSTYGTAGTLRFDMVTVSAVPEPEAYALMLAGLGMLGWVARRRRG
jgi:hypothetical protein